MVSTAAEPTRDNRPLRTIETDAYMEARSEEHKELVTPAPRGYRPKARGRKLSIRLVARDTKIKAGDKFWYRLELLNEGSLPLRVSEFDSFLKRGDRSDFRKWEFTALTPAGEKRRMEIGCQEAVFENPANKKKVVSIPGSDKMTDAEIARFIRENEAWRQEDRALHVTLKPGEKLTSRPWKRTRDEVELKPSLVKQEKSAPPKFDGFREYWTCFEFDLPGRYEITVTFNDPVRPPPEEARLARMEAEGVPRDWVLSNYRKESSDRLGRITSNTVLLDITR